MSTSGLLTVKEVASYLRVSPDTVYRWSEQNIVPFIRLQGRGVRFRQKDLDAWLEKQANVPLPVIPPGPGLTLSRGSTKKKPHGKTGGTGEMARAKIKARRNLGYGAVYQRVTKEGIVRWYLDYRDAKGERVQKVASQASSYEEAVLALKGAVVGEHHRALGIGDAPQKTKFSELSKLYLDNYARLNKRSWRDDQYRLNAHMVPYFGETTLDDITSLSVEKYKAKRMEDKVSKSTVNRELTILKKMFNLAIDWGITDRNPALKVKQFSEKDTAVERILTAGEERRLFAECPAYLRPIITTALHTGMRRGEIFDLRWAQVDLAKRVIQVKHTKSGKDRHIPINGTLFKTLAGLKASNGTSDYVFPNPETGKPYAEVKKSFKQACKRAEITDLRFHDLRHTFATRLVTAGVDIVTVRDLLGHFSVRVTQRYTHPGHDLKVAAVGLLARRTAKKGEKLLHPCYTN